MKKIICLALSFFCAVVFAQEATKEVSLLVSADGATKTEAINNALRSAIEQTFGTFVSANTELLNDQIVKDEIATISSGNIQKYTEVTSITLPNGNTSVTLNVTVSLKKLVKYAQSKGSECEFAGATFGANARMYEFNKKNEQHAIQNMIKQLDALRPVYDYEIEVSEPVINNTNESRLKWLAAGQKEEIKTANIEVQVTIKANNKTKVFNEIIQNTIMSLAMTEKHIKPMMDAGFEYKPYMLCLDGKIKNISVDKYNERQIIPNNIYYFYTDEINILDEFINNAMYDFSITDNMGNEFLIMDAIEKSAIIGHRIIIKPSNNKICWGFEYEAQSYTRRTNGWEPSPLFNTHTNYLKVKTVNLTAENFYSAKTPLIAINHSKIVWVFPKIPFTIPVENINNISKITIKPTKENATNFVLSTSIIDSKKICHGTYVSFSNYYGAIAIYKSSIYTKYNIISSDQTKIKNLKELRSQYYGAINSDEL